MYQIKIVKYTGASYRCAAESLSAVKKLAELTAVQEIIIYAITPRDLSYLTALDLPSKIKIIR